MENKGFLYFVCAEGGNKLRVLWNASLLPTTANFGNECKPIIPSVHVGFMPFVGTWCHTKGHLHTYLGQQCMIDFSDEIVVIVLLSYRNCKAENELPIKFHLFVEDKLSICIWKYDFALYICEQLHTGYYKYVSIYIYGYLSVDWMGFVN